MIVTFADFKRRVVAVHCGSMKVELVAIREPATTHLLGVILEPGLEQGDSERRIQHQERSLFEKAATGKMPASNVNNQF